MIAEASIGGIALAFVVLLSKHPQIKITILVMIDTFQKFASLIQLPSNPLIVIQADLRQRIYLCGDVLYHLYRAAWRPSKEGNGI